MPLAAREHSDSWSSRPEAGVGLGWVSAPGMLALPPWPMKTSIMQREHQMHSNMLAPASQCPAFSVVRISSLSSYFHSHHLRI